MVARAKINSKLWRSEISSRLVSKISLPGAIAQIVDAIKKRPFTSEYHGAEHDEPNRSQRNEVEALVVQNPGNAGDQNDPDPTPDSVCDAHGDDTQRHRKAIESKRIAYYHRH